MHEHANQQTKHGLSFKIYENKNKTKKTMKLEVFYVYARLVAGGRSIFLHYKSQPNLHTHNPTTHHLMPSTMSKLE